MSIRWIMSIWVALGIAMPCWAQAMRVGGFTSSDVTDTVKTEQRRAQDQLRRARQEDQKLKEKQYKEVEGLIDTHVKNQRTSEEFRKEGKEKPEHLLYVRMLEFHDHDGDGIVDHGTSAEASELERAFSPEQVMEGKKLKIYQYMKAHEFKNSEGQVIQHFQRQMKKEQEKKAAQIGLKYAEKVLVRDKSGRVISTFVEDSLRDANEKIKEHSEDALYFQRLKRLEKYQALKQKKKEQQIKASFEVKGEQAVSTYPDLGKERQRNLQAFESALQEYKKKHPECLKAEINCYVGKDGVIRVERMSDTKNVASQVEDTQEYEAQAQVLMTEGGDALLKRLPGEVEDMTAAQKRAIQEERQKYQQRRVLLQNLIEKKRQTKIKKGKVVTEETSTGEKATAEKIRELDQPSAFRDRKAAGKEGKIDPKKLKKYKGKTPLRFLDY